MLRAIAGSISLGDGLTKSRAASDSVMLCAEGGHDAEQPQQASSHQQQADNEQDMVRTGKDMINPSRNELLHHRGPALTITRSVNKDLTVLSEDLLMDEIVIFIHVEESLMLRIVWKERALNSERRRSDDRVESQLER
jgi:hypothetical protein